MTHCAQIITSIYCPASKLLTSSDQFSAFQTLYAHGKCDTKQHPHTCQNTHKTN